MSGEASHHHGWHNAEHAREKLLRGEPVTGDQLEAAAAREQELAGRWSSMWPTPAGPGWVDWADEPRVIPTRRGYQVLNRDGSIGSQIFRANDGTPAWIRRTPTGQHRAPSAHQALLDAVDGQPDPAALRRPAPAGVPQGVQTTPVPQPNVDYNPEWLTGVKAEDDLVKLGKCPFQEETAGWGQTERFCGGERSPHEADHPFCGPHANDIRADRGYGGPV